MTGRINLTPEALQHLHQLDEWISQNASADTARRFVSSVLDHVEGILQFPFAGRPRDDVRAGLRTTTYKKRTLIAYIVDESGDEVVANVVGVFHGGQDWSSALREE